MSPKNFKSKDQNPRNPASTLFRKLTRLFSGPMIDYKSQLPRRLKQSTAANYGSRIKSASGQQFKKSQYNPYESLQASYMANQNRADRYVDFDQMEYTPEIASALDIYADEMTTSTAINPLLSIKCPNEEIKTVLGNLYHNILNIEYNLFGWCRSMCKYGDFFLYLDIDDDQGVTHALGLPPQEIERLEGEDTTNPNYVQYQWNTGGITFENWQMAHFRVLGNDKYSPYGTSILEPARRIWRQLTLIEDAMMAYRIVRSPERRVFYIDVGNIAAPDVEQYMQKVMTQMKRNQVIDQDTGRVDLRYNPMSVEEDYFIPTRGGTSSKVESLPGGTYTGDIDDVKYLRDKLFSALKVPASYLSQGEEGASEDKTTLAQKDVRFARTIQRLQRSILSEIQKIGVVHLFTLGYRGTDLLSFTLHLNNPSKLAELQELEHWRTKFDVAAAATEGFFSRRWVAENMFNLPEEEIVRIKREMFHDKKFDALLEKASEEITAAGGEEEGGLDIGGGMDAGGLDLDTPAVGDEEIPGAEPEADAPEDDGGVLLAEPPGNRDSEEYTTPGSKGKAYKKVKDDKRKHMAPRNKNMKSLSGIEQGGTRKAFKGHNELMSFAKGIQEQNYASEEEKKLHEVNYEIKKLIKEMETKKHEVPAQ